MSEFVVDALIEIPLNCQNKYEFDKERGLIRLDRVLFTPMNYPAEYGYIERTLAEDNDPLDILVLASTPTFPGCIVTARIVGCLKMLDSGVEDYKILAVSHKDPRFNHIKDLGDISLHTLKEIEYFFAHYKELQELEVSIIGWESSDSALSILKSCCKKYEDYYRNC